jgi:hypothetical protein
MANKEKALCSEDGCERPSICWGLCNAHYLRKKRGYDIVGSLRERDPGKVCIVEDCEKKAKSGKMCTKHYRAWMRHSIKNNLIKKMGGVCSACKGSFHPAAYDFHHLDPSKKDFGITSAMIKMSLQRVLEEAEKCILLCANCHRIEHAGERYA